MQHVLVGGFTSKDLYLSELPEIKLTVNSDLPGNRSGERFFGRKTLLLFLKAQFGEYTHNMTRHHYNVHCLALRILLRITLQDENMHRVLTN